MRRLLLPSAAVVALAACATLEADFGAVSPTPIPSPTPTGQTPTPTPLPTPFGTGQDGEVTLAVPTVVSTCEKLLLGTGSTLTFPAAGETFAANTRILVMQVNDDFATMGSSAD